MLFSRASKVSNFLIFVLFLGGLSDSGACFAHETTKHRAESHHFHHHTHKSHPKLHRHEHEHSAIPQKQVHHAALVTHDERSADVRSVAEKTVMAHEENKVQENTENKTQANKTQENKVRTIIKVAEVKSDTAKEHRWHRYWVEHREAEHRYWEEHREAGRRWAVEHHIHNPHLIRRSIEFATNTEHGIVALVHNAISSLRSTHYRYGGNYFNMSSGVYEVDCSDYVDDLLKISQPRAYADLADSTGTEKPTSSDYYRFFNNLPDNSGHAWQRVDDVESLRPGDILVFHNYRGGGHVMVVMGTPKLTQDDDNTYLVQVSDSASSRHSDDTRAPHVSGVGIGTLLLKANPETGEPSAYAWTVDSGWDHVRIAMAEPLINV